MQQLGPLFFLGGAGLVELGVQLFGLFPFDAEFLIKIGVVPQARFPFFAFCHLVFLLLQRILAGELVPQAVVNTLLCQQLLVGAGFLNALGTENEDAVVVLDRGQPVGDGQGRAAMGQLFEALAYEDLTLVVQALVASSRMRMGGFLRKTRAMAMRCFWPPESLTPRSPT